MAWSAKNCILVPYDFSDHSLRAVDQALEMCENSSQVHVIHVLPYLIPAEPGVIWADIDDSQRIEHAKRALDDALKGAAYTGTQRHVLVGDAGGVCVEQAEKLKADMIVLPSHGRTGVNRLLLGSIAERIVRLAKCPVLVIKLNS